MYYIDTNVLMNATLLLIMGASVLLLCVTLFLAWWGKRGRVMSYLYMLTIIFGAFSVAVVVLGSRGEKSSERPWHFFLDMKYQGKYTSQGQSKYFADGRSSRLPPEGAIPFDGTDYAADAGTHNMPNPDFLKADPRYYFGIADAKAKETKDGVEVLAKPKWHNKTTVHAENVQSIFKPHGRWFRAYTHQLRLRVKSEVVLEEGYYVNHIPPAAVEKAGGWEPLLKRGQTQFDRHCAACHGRCGRGGSGDAAYGTVGAYGLSVPPANILTPEIQSQADGQLFNTVSSGVRQMPGYGHQIRDVLDRWAIVAYIRELQFAYGNSAIEKK
jgi:mono/diheme cytochrome c family protein